MFLAIPSSMTVLKKLRERKRVPALFLTARDDVEGSVRGLDLALTIIS